MNWKLIAGDFVHITAIELQMSGGWKKTPATAQETLTGIWSFIPALR